MHIFVSYTVRDGFFNIRTLSQIENHLMSVGNTYIDLLHNDSPHPQEHVLDVLRKSSVVLACVTPASYSSKWFRMELEIAKQIGIPIITLAFNDGTLDTIDWDRVRESILKAKPEKYGSTVAS